MEGAGAAAVWATPVASEPFGAEIKIPESRLSLGPALGDPAPDSVEDVEDGFDMDIAGGKVFMAAAGAAGPLFFIVSEAPAPFLGGD